MVRLRFCARGCRGTGGDLKIDKIISRRNAVKRIALTAGYPEWRAEDIAQEAACALIANPNLESQTNRQAFIDAIRSSIERSYDRRGSFVVPIFESEFENYTDFVNGLRSESNPERESIISRELFDLKNNLSVLKPNHREMLVMYAEGFKLGEISKRFGVCESRVYQIIDVSRVKIKEAIISNRLSSQESRKRKWFESQSIPRKIQAGSEMQRSFSGKLETISIFKGFRLESFKIPKIPQEIFRSF